MNLKPIEEWLQENESHRLGEIEDFIRDLSGASGKDQDETDEVIEVIEIFRVAILAGLGVDGAKSIATVAVSFSIDGQRIEPPMIAEAVISVLASYSLEHRDSPMVADWFKRILDAGDVSLKDLLKCTGFLLPIASVYNVPLDAIGAVLAMLNKYNMVTAPAICRLRREIIAFSNRS